MRKAIKDYFSFTKKEIHANNEATPRTAANQIYHGAPARIRITKIHQLKNIFRMIGSIGFITFKSYMRLPGVIGRLAM